MFLCRRRLLNAYFTKKPHLLPLGIRHFVRAKRAVKKTDEDDPFNVGRGAGSGQPKKDRGRALRSVLDHSVLLERLQKAIKATKVKEEKARHVRSKTEVKEAPGKGSSSTSIDISSGKLPERTDEQSPVASASRGRVLEQEKTVLPTPNAVPGELESLQEFTSLSAGQPHEQPSQSSVAPEQVSAQTEVQSSIPSVPSSVPVSNYEQPLESNADHEQRLAKKKATAKVPIFSNLDLTLDPNRYENSLQLYLYYHEHDRQQLSTFPRAAFENASKKAYELGQLDTVDNIARDLLEFYRGENGVVDNEQRCRPLAKFITTFREDGILRDSTVLALFDAWVESGGPELGFLSLKALDRITDALVATHLSGPHGSPYAPAAQRLIDILIRYSQTQLAENPKAHKYEPPYLVSKLFTLIQAYISVEHHDVALDIFQRLVDLSFIPRDAITQAEKLYESSKDFRLIVLSALVKACLQWNWRVRAVPLMIDLIQSYSILDEEIKTSTETLLDSLLKKESLRSLKYAQKLASLFISRTSSDLLLPDYFVSRIYSQAYELRDEPKDEKFDVDASDIAEAMYELTQRSNNVKKHVYPPPDGRVITWFLAHLTHKSNRQDLARKLVQQVIDAPMDLPVHSRAEIIALSASNSFGMLARTLWERYAAEGLFQPTALQRRRAREARDRRLVTGNPGTAIRMVSMFMNLSEREAAKVQSLAQNIADKTKLSVTQPLPEQVATKLMTDEEELEFRKGRMQDFDNFAKLVATRYRETQEPFEDADHRHLNALARIYFLLGDISAGFDVFRVMIDRQEIPDHYDLNVSLSVLVQHDARAAGQMIRKMVEKGLQPSSVALGTVLNGAMAQGDAELVDWLLRFAKRESIEITMKSVAAGVFTSISQSMQHDTPEQLRGNLDVVLNLVRVNSDERYLPTVATGKLCVNAAVKADSAELAYNFWRILLYRRAEWDDRQQQQLRRMIAVQIRREVLDGSLDKEAAREMVDLLGFATFDVGSWHPEWTTIPRDMMENYDFEKSVD
ncbi:hypothetical protein NEOLEDRAFT_1109213 [Neolentinus lepideus HHB14362 ss-1]|uniref:Pentacotripeptide-repeat region of PRORP domain-containing protein n=1 Tax=Neolentinus lepideus HHB14362 ss-1 TaxID=1314782 RepID=A0A165UL78_9AGAM|nr:hypothetical protein NEOLEDRAFT_1109213 [Neolentinus lepideus HHB14362 ss-1]